MGVSESVYIQLKNVLSKVRENLPDLEGVLVAGRDGLLMAAEMTEGVDSEQLAAMAATLLATSENALARTGRGKLRKVMASGENGDLIVVGAGEAVIAALTGRNPVRGLFFLVLETAATQVESIVKSWTEKMAGGEQAGLKPPSPPVV